MGFARADFELRNPGKTGLGSLKVSALVDTGALMLCVPEHVRKHLELDEVECREVTTADGTRHLVPYVGPVQVRFANRSCFVGALVMGDEVLMGVVPMEDMDLVISPARRTVVVNPESPNFPQALVK